MEPNDGRRIQSGRRPADVPWALCIPKSPTTGANQNCIAGTDVNTGLCFPRVEVGPCNEGIRIEVRQAPQPGDVHQDASSKDAIPILRCTEYSGAGRADVGRGIAVVKMTFVVGMRKSVKVAERDTMKI